MTAAGEGRMVARELVDPRRLWFGVFGAPFAWATQLLVDYAVVAHACSPDGVPLLHPVIGGARAISLGVSVVCLGIAVAAVSTARGSLAKTRRAPETASSTLATVHGRARFMARAGLIVSILFTFGLLMAALPLITRSACG